MSRRLIERFTSLLLGGALLLAAGAATAMPVDFKFTAQCDDCAFNGNPGDIDFDPFDDGLFEVVTGTLHLNDDTLNAQGLIDVGGSNFESFDYDGSSLLNPFTFTDPSTIRGLLSPTGAVDPSEALVIQTSAGDFSDFCTALGAQLLDDCSGVGLAFFELDSSGTWSVFGTESFDTGGGGQLAVVPEPASGVMLSLALLGAGYARRETNARG